jgi:hypothetical protein
MLAGHLAEREEISSRLTFARLASCEACFGAAEVTATAGATSLRILAPSKVLLKPSEGMGRDDRERHENPVSSGELAD